MEQVALALVTVAPLALVFTTNRLFPFSDAYQMQPAPFQPPGWFFTFAWTYITLTLGATTAYTIHQTSDWTNVALSVLLVVAWCAWIVNESRHADSNNKSLVSLSLLVTSGAILCMFVAEIRAKIGWFSYLLLPAVVWLFVACALQGYHYDPLLVKPKQNKKKN